MFGLWKLRKTAEKMSDDFKASVSELELQILWGDLTPEKKEQGRRILERLKEDLEKKKDRETHRLGGGSAPAV
jgi:hypothetical protein